jgi:hypothetical protein
MIRQKEAVVFGFHDVQSGNPDVIIGAAIGCRVRCLPFRDR